MAKIQTRKKISAGERAYLLAKIEDGAFVLEYGDEKYISGNTKTETFWNMFVSERGGDKLDANDDIYDILMDIVANRPAYSEELDQSFINDRVWFFQDNKYYVKMAVLSSRWLTVVIHYHWQLD